jgi:hypothetical protein
LTSGEWFNSAVAKRAVAVPGGVVMKTVDGGYRMQRHGSYSGLEIDEVEEESAMDGMDVDRDEGRPIGGKGLGQVLR